MKLIAVTGSVGSGKTTLSRKIAKNFNWNYIDITKTIKENKLSSSYDKKRKCAVVDIKKLNNFLISKIIIPSNKNIIIDSHLSHYLPKEHVDLCIVTKCDIKTLEARLKKRDYNNKKIRENLDCEIFDILLNEAKENKHNTLVVDTSKGMNAFKVFNAIKKKLRLK